MTLRRLKMLVKPDRPLRLTLPLIGLDRVACAGVVDERLLLRALLPLRSSDQLGSRTELLEHDDELGSNSGVGGEGWRPCCCTVTALRRPEGPRARRS